MSGILFDIGEATGQIMIYISTLGTNRGGTFKDLCGEWIERQRRIRAACISDASIHDLKTLYNNLLVVLALDGASIREDPSAEVYHGTLEHRAETCEEIDKLCEAIAGR